MRQTLQRKKTELVRAYLANVSYCCTAKTIHIEPTIGDKCEGRESPERSGSTSLDRTSTLAVPRTKIMWESTDQSVCILDLRALTHLLFYYHGSTNLSTILASKSERESKYFSLN